MWVIYLKCYECSGYFTGIITTSADVEVGVHPQRYRAKKFDSRDEAFKVAGTLKPRFKCIISYTIVQL